MNGEGLGGVLGQLLPYAIGVAISPVPVIAVVLLLLGPHPGRSGGTFLGGWLIGIVVATTVFVLLSAVVTPSDDPSSPVVGWIELGLGVLLLVAGVRQLHARARRDGPAPLPGWMTAIDAMTPGRALAIGAALAAVNPKNLGLCLAAGSTIGGAELAVAPQVVAVGAFTVLAAVSVAGPVVAYAVAAERMRKPLDRLHGWLVEENAVVMGTVLTVMGAVLAGHGITGVTG